MGGGGHKKACKVQGEGHVFEHPKNGEGYLEYFTLLSMGIPPTPPPKKNEYSLNCPG